MAVLPIGIGSAGGTPAGAVESSLRFNSADSANLTRTPTTTGSRRIYTHSAWFKRTGLSSTGFNVLWASESSGTNYVGFVYYQDKFYWNFYNGTTSYVVETTQVFRDVSAWSHIVVAVDTTQATASNRVRIYHNGVQITVFNTSNYPPQDQDLPINTSSFVHKIGFSAGFSQYLNGYMTEVNFLDGYPTVGGTTYNATTWAALNVSTLFGETDSATGVWKPKAYTGTYGTNGFYLKFADNSGTTSTTLGKDSSGNGNNWTPNNFSVTAGTGNDSLVDSPTAYGTDTGVGGEVRGNYCTLNLLASGTNTTLANGALDFSCGTTQYSTSVATLGLKGGKWYWEVTANSNGIAVGIMSSNANLAPSALNLAGPGESVNGWHYQYNAYRITNNTAVSYGATFSTNDVIGVALDLDAGTIVFYKNGTSQGTAYSGLSTSLSYFPAVGDGTNGVAASCSCNFGQRPFEKWNGSAYVANTAPSGFKALCTQNLPTPTIGATSTTQANDYFNAVIYTGTSASTQAVTGVGFQPDFVWVKSRSLGVGSLLYDAVRGAGSSKALQSNATDYEGLGFNVTAASSRGYISSFDSDGFTAADGTTSGQYSKANTSTYVSWNWKANGAGVTNTAGQITSTVSANNDAGFSIVTYTGNGSANQTVGHGCKVGGVATAPAFGILKDRDSNSNNDQWQVFHTGAGDKYGYLSTTAAFAGTAEFYPTSGSSTTVTVGRGVAATTNESGDRFVMYLFAPVAGYSAFGSYEANNSADGVFVYLGFRPKWIMFKRSSTGTNSWVILDSVRNTYNVTDNALYPNQTYTENGTIGTEPVDFLSNGFKIRASNSEVNGTGTYIYAAFAESPFKYSLAR